MKPQYSEVHTFRVTSTATTSSVEGVRLFINGKKIIDAWTTTVTSHAATVGMIQNRLYSIKLDYKEIDGSAKSVLEWSSSSLSSYAVIPSDRLYHTEEQISGSPFSVVFT